MPSPAEVRGQVKKKKMVKEEVGKSKNRYLCATLWLKQAGKQSFPLETSTLTVC